MFEPGPTRIRLHADDAASISTTITGIQAMTCARCESTVERAITDAGGTNAGADWRTGSVQFSRDAAMPIDRFHLALEAAGHPTHDPSQAPAKGPRGRWIAGVLGGGGTAGLLMLCCSFGTAVVLGGIGATAGAALRNPFLIAVGAVVLSGGLLLRFRRGAPSLAVRRTRSRR